MKLSVHPTGYSGVSLYTLIKHVYAKHGKITLKMVNENEAIMKSDFDIDANTLEELWVRQDKCQTFLVDEVETITEATWLRHTETVLEATGQFEKACEKWTEKDYFNKSKANFITHFDTHHEKYLNSNKTLTEAGIANNVEIEVLKRHIETQDAKSNEMTNILNELHDRMDTQSVASSVPRSIGPAVPTANTARELDLQAQIDRLRAEQRNPVQQRDPVEGGGGRDDGRGRGRGRGGRGRGRGGGGPGRGPRVYDNSADDGRTEKYFRNQNYCHTHGWDVSRYHYSPQCHYPNEGHDTTATANDTKGGSELYKRLSHKA